MRPRSVSRRRSSAGRKEMRPIVTCTHIRRNNWWKMLTLQLLTCRWPYGSYFDYADDKFKRSGWNAIRDLIGLRLRQDLKIPRIRVTISLARENIIINGEGNTTIFESIDISFLFLFSILVPDGRTDWYFSFSIRPFTVDGAPVIDDILLAYYPPLLSSGFFLFRPIYIYIYMCTVCLCCIDVDVSARAFQEIRSCASIGFSHISLLFFFFVFFSSSHPMYM